jgi:hypothetical protein
MEAKYAVGAKVRLVFDPRWGVTPCIVRRVSLSSDGVMYDVEVTGAFPNTGMPAKVPAPDPKLVPLSEALGAMAVEAERFWVVRKPTLLEAVEERFLLGVTEVLATWAVFDAADVPDYRGWVLFYGLTKQTRAKRARRFLVVGRLWSGDPVDVGGVSLASQGLHPTHWVVMGGALPPLPDRPDFSISRTFR